MTILHKLRDNRDRHAVRRRQRLEHGEPEVRHTEAWEHETFAEEQARWERGDGEYARICEEVRQAQGEEASRRADEAKANWDDCAAPRRQASDDAERALHLNMPTRLIDPEPACIPDDPALNDGPALSDGPSKLEVE